MCTLHQQGHVLFKREIPGGQHSTKVCLSLSPRKAYLYCHEMGDSTLYYLKIVHQSIA